MRSAALTFLACAIACAAHAQTNVYRWVDKDGKVHYTDGPPPETAANVTQKRLGGGAINEAELPYATREAMKRNPVTLYTGNSCGNVCAEGRAILSNRGIPFSERNAETNKEDQEALRKLIGALEVPVLVIGERSPMKGLDADAWQTALDGAGYPRTKLPGQAAARQPAAGGETK